MHQLVVIAPLAPMIVGDTFEPGVGRVPLHLTVLPRVEVGRKERSAALSAVAGIAARTTRLSVAAVGLARLGEVGTVRVTLMRLSPSLRRLHLHLLDAVPGQCVEPRYCGIGYRPHITHTSAGGRVPVGGRVTLTHLAVLDCSNDERHLVAIDRLSG